jgi:hypothetical protein
MSYDNCVLRVIPIALMLAAVDFAAQTVDGHVVNSVTGIDIPGVAVNLVRAGWSPIQPPLTSRAIFGSRP